jgi:hypothetical protein
MPQHPACATACHAACPRSMPQHATACHSMPQHATACAACAACAACVNMRQYDDDPECVRNRHRVPHRACRDSFPYSHNIQTTPINFDFLCRFSAHFSNAQALGRTRHGFSRLLRPGLQPAPGQLMYECGATHRALSCTTSTSIHCSLFAPIGVARWPSSRAARPLAASDQQWWPSSSPRKPPSLTKAERRRAAAPPSRRRTLHARGMPTTGGPSGPSRAPPQQPCKNLPTSPNRLASTAPSRAQPSRIAPPRV